VDVSVSIHMLSNAFLIQLQPINDLDFHPQNTVLISGAKDHTIKYEIL
jgi:WD40 repeat protein